MLLKKKRKMRDLQPTISQLRYFEFELPGSLTEKRRKQTRALSAYSLRSSSRNAQQPRVTPPSSAKLPTSSHKCISIGGITQPKDCQNILVGSALRRPHATGYSTMDYQTMPDVGKAPKQPYRPQTAGTVYTYANRPLSAAEVGNKHGKQNKSSLLRKKASSCDLIRSSRSFESLSHGTSTNAKKRLCKIREDYRPFKSGHDYQPTTPHGESIHSFLIGARYNNTRYFDSKTFSKLGVYIPKADLQTFFIKENNWIKPDDDEPVEVDVDGNELNMITLINELSEDIQPNLNKVVENSANTENKAVNTEPHYLSIDRWHSADWQKERKTACQKVLRAHSAPSRFKPINTFYYDYDSGKKYKYGI